MAAAGQISPFFARECSTLDQSQTLQQNFSNAQECCLQAGGELGIVHNEQEQTLAFETCRQALFEETSACGCQIGAVRSIGSDFQADQCVYSDPLSEGKWLISSCESQCQEDLTDRPLVLCRSAAFIPIQPPTLSPSSQTEFEDDFGNMIYFGLVPVFVLTAIFLLAYLKIFKTGFHGVGTVDDPEVIAAEVESMKKRLHFPKLEV